MLLVFAVVFVVFLLWFWLLYCVSAAFLFSFFVRFFFGFAVRLCFFVALLLCVFFLTHCFFFIYLVCEYFAVVVFVSLPLCLWICGLILFILMGHCSLQRHIYFCYNGCSFCLKLTKRLEASTHVYAAKLKFSSRMVLHG